MRGDTSVVFGITVGLVVSAMVGCATTPPPPLEEPTRIIWSNPRDPQLARFPETSAGCRSEGDAKYAEAESGTSASAIRLLETRRQQYWFDCMKTRGYAPREVGVR